MSLHTPRKSSKTPNIVGKLRLLLLPLLVALTSDCSNEAASSLLRLPASQTMSPSDLRVATYNVYFRTRDGARTLAILRQAEADVVALQEVTQECVPLLDKECAADYPYRFFAEGLGLLSRFPLRNARAERSRRGINGFLFAEVEHPRGRVQIANVHLDPLRLWSARDLARLPLQLRTQRDIQRDELAQVQARLKPGMPTILTGDFNRVSNDVVKKLRQLGFIDSLASVTRNPDSLSTLHFSVLGLRLGRRIDYIFHDRSFHTAQSEIFPGRPSDHDVLASRLAWRSAAPPQQRHAGPAVEKQAPGQSSNMGARAMADAVFVP